MQRGPRAIGSFVALGLMSGVLACASPTLPLPPPGPPPTLEAGPDADHVKLVGGCDSVEAYAIVVVINENVAVAGDEAVSGSRADSCGAWEAIVFAHAGDTLDIYQEYGTLRSGAVTVQVR